MDENQEKEILTKALTSVMVERANNEDEDIVGTYSFFFAVAGFINILFIVGIVITVIAGIVAAINADSFAALLIAVISAAILWFVRLLSVYAVKWFGYLLKTNYEMVKYIKKK